MNRKIQYTRHLALLLALLLILTAAAGTTLAFVADETPSIINTFLSGVTPTGSLTIVKTVAHPFGGNYFVPDNENTVFTFAVDLGAANADSAFGDFRTDSEGKLTVTVKAGGSVTIPDVPAGTTAVVTETGMGPGFTPDAVEKSVTLGRDGDTLSFVNDYVPESASTEELNVTGTKTLDGRDWQEGDRFEFVLEVQQDGVWTALGTRVVEYAAQPDPENSEQSIYTVNPNFDFNQEIRAYPLDTVGVYSFRIREVNGAIGGITYAEAAEFEIAVTDTDMDGCLEIRSVTSRSENTTVNNRSIHADFTNTYTSLGSDSVAIVIQKTLTDNSGKNRNPDGFTFVLEDEDGNQITKTTDSSGNAAFVLTYETKDADKTFRYTLKETNEGLRGMDYDDTVYAYQVEVTGNVDGTISALIREYDPEDTDEPDSEEDAEEDTEDTESEEDMEDTDPEGSKAVGAKFHNTYTPDPASLTVDGIKKLDGRAMEEGEFTFQLFETEAGFVIPEGAEPVRTAENTADGTFTFDELTFSKVGWYYFVAKEDSSAALGGITYDQTWYNLRVFVNDSNGALYVEQVSVEDPAGKAAEVIRFENTYKPEKAILTLTGTKNLSGRELKAREFTFHLYEASYLTSYGFTKGELYARSTNDMEMAGEITGKFSFRIEYPEAGTFHYIVTESAGKETGMSYDETQYGVEVVVTDDGAGQLSARVTRLVKLGDEDTPADEILFRNTYTAPDTPQETTKPQETTQPEESSDVSEPGGSTETKLPQTGQLWWPVPVLLLCGIAFILLGLLRPRGKYHD